MRVQENRRIIMEKISNYVSGQWVNGDGEELIG